MDTPNPIKKSLIRIHNLLIDATYERLVDALGQHVLFNSAKGV